MGLGHPLLHVRMWLFSYFFSCPCPCFSFSSDFHGFLLSDFSFLFFYTSDLPRHNMHAACCMQYAKTTTNEDEILRIQAVAFWDEMALSRNSQVACAGVYIILLCSIGRVHLDWSGRYGSLSSARSVFSFLINLVPLVRLLFSVGTVILSFFSIYISPFCSQNSPLPLPPLWFCIFPQSTLVVISYFLRNMKNNQ